MAVLSVILVVIGLIIVLCGIWEALNRENGWYLIISFIGLAAFVSGLLVAPLDYADDITGKAIEYKSIDPSDGRYYAIGEDGSIYRISKETWASLDVSIIAETK